MTWYAQFGEDEWIVNNLQIPEHGYFVEIGVGLGLLHSNSKYLEDIGWEGLLIEADPDLIEIIKSNRKSQVLNFAITDYVGTVNFIQHHRNKELSGILRAEVDGTSIRVPCTTIEKLLNKNKHIDLMSIDTEGSEVSILNCIGEIRPSILIVEYETDGLGNFFQQVLDKLVSMGYKSVHQTRCNIIAVPA